MHLTPGSFPLFDSWEFKVPTADISTVTTSDVLEFQNSIFEIEMKIFFHF